METINMPVQLVNAILNYLGSRPYVEVASLINGIQQAAAPKEAENPGGTE
jgi:hypothetical protein